MVVGSAIERYIGIAIILFQFNFDLMNVSLALN